MGEDSHQHEASPFLRSSWLFLSSPTRGFPPPKLTPSIRGVARPAGIQLLSQSASSERSELQHCCVISVPRTCVTTKGWEPQHSAQGGAQSGMETESICSDPCTTQQP